MSDITIGGPGVIGTALADIAAVNVQATISATESEIIDHHFHSFRRFIAQAAVPSGETHVADQFSPTAPTAFQIDAGNNTWGAWVQCVGSLDTPIVVGNTLFDNRWMVVTATERNAAYIIQVAYGASGAAALSAGTYTEIVIVPLSATNDKISFDLQGPRQTSGTKIWIRCFCPGQNTGTVDFYLGFHEYVV